MKMIELPESIVRKAARSDRSLMMYYRKYKKEELKQSPPELPDNIIEVLKEAGITVEDARKMKPEELVKVKGIGKKSAELILAG